ncbi:hypothetical protein ACFXTN_020887 [Malus domestica]
MESLESFDELLDFPSDVGEEDKDEDFEASNALPGDDPSCQFSETECSEEVLEWLSNKEYPAMAGRRSQGKESLV